MRSGQSGTLLLRTGESMHETYVIQGIMSGSILCDEFSMSDEGKARLAAKGLLMSPMFEGDSVRIITCDGELVWDSKQAEKG